MFFNIDPRNGLAIYDQIVRQVKFAVASSVLRTGEMVPSVRELARELAVNPNTVARAYRELQNDSVLNNVRGTGLEVSPEAHERCSEDRTRLIGERLRSVLLEARQSGLADADIRRIAEQQFLELNREARPT